MPTSSPSTGQLLSIVEKKASALSAASDQLNAAYEAIQKRLLDSGIGLEAWVSINTTRSRSEAAETAGIQIWDEDQLGYGRFGDGWALLTRTAHFEDNAEGGHWTYGEVKPLIRSPRKVRIEAVADISTLLLELDKQADRVLQQVAEAKHLAYGSPSSNGCLWCRVEATSSRRLALGQRRECPSCDHVFQGKGWDGVDAHWKAAHEKPLGIPYDDFWRGIMGCVRHWGV
jgi:hypothetical protein